MASKPIYDQYYTHSDVTVDLFNPARNIRVNIDKVVAIAFTHNNTTIPIYGLGNPLPIFFSKGNSLLQGQLDIAFKHTEYMQAAISYVLGSYDKTEVVNVLTKQTLAAMTPEEIREYKTSINTSSSVTTSKSLVGVVDLLDIIITFNNSSATSSGVSSIMTLKGVKFTSQSSAVHSQDDNALVDRFTFYGRNIE